MKKKRSIQKKREKVRKYTEQICFIILLLTGALFLFLGIDYALMYSSWNEAKTVEFTGNYSIHDERPFRITIYSFELDNGFNFSVPSTLIENEQQLVNASEKGVPIPLKFRFLVEYSPFPRSSYAIIAISSEDGINYIDESIMYQRTSSTARICILLSLIIFFPLLLVSFFWYLGKGKDIIRKKLILFRRKIPKLKNRNLG